MVRMRLKDRLNYLPLLDGRRENRRKKLAGKFPADFFTAGYCLLIPYSGLQSALSLFSDKKGQNTGSMFIIITS